MSKKQRRIKLKPKFNRHQYKFYQDLTSRRLHLSTGFGGGKTYSLIWKMIQLSQINFLCHGGLMAPSLVEFKKDVLPLSEEIFEEYKIPFHFNGQHNYFSFPWTNKRCYVVSGEKKIRGPNWGYGLINELTLCPLVRYKEFLGRVRDKKASCPQVASSGTPEGMASEYYDYMIENPRDNFTVLYGSTKDNIQNLAEGFIDDLYSDYDSVMQQAYIEGLWVNMTGNRFYYAYDSKINDDKKIKQKDYSMVHIGMDFNVDPMAATCWNFDGNTLTAFDEITIHDSNTREMAAAMKARGYDPDSCIIYPDPSGRSRSTKGDPDITILQDCGYYEIRNRKKAPGFRTRQLNVNNLFEKKKVRINPDKCPRLRKDFMAVEQDTVTLEKIKKNKDLTHHSDGFDYLCDILFPFKGRSSSGIRIGTRM